MARNNGGLARVVTTPEPREYLVAQFLGEQPPTVPAVLTNELRTPAPAMEEN
ncbi:MAG TPA: hypothetical protein H9867_05805 [Candidatus Corynebacterium gallistercoris]|uniref:Uncharacterized protein n=1 Tax=Candidatus Corynebacterium gallistercoris TaxID=2838530 RepID=A0A9D1URE5_9CORY|nr:hypothetical protein [Candidatus Corynebacterium gallistercoris]